MRLGADVFLAGIIVGRPFGYALLFHRASEIVPGATAYKPVGRCELIHFDERLQSFPPLVLACPRMDMIRLWPLPVVQPWDEEWFDRFQELDNPATTPETIVGVASQISPVTNG